MDRSEEATVDRVMKMMDEGSTNDAACALMEGARRQPAKLAARVILFSMTAVDEHGQVGGMAAMSRLMRKLDCAPKGKW